MEADLNQSKDSTKESWPNFFSDWKRWFNQLSLAEKISPLLLVSLYLTVIFLLDGFQRDDSQRYYFLSGTILFFAYAGNVFRNLLKLILPVLLVILIYDSFYYYSDLIIGEINIAEPYLLEKQWFGVSTEQGTLTLNEWFSTRTHWFLDLTTGFIYLMYVLSLVLFSLFLLLYSSKKGTSKYSGEDISKRAPNILWSFFITNVLGYTTWHIYPAAPPWYVEIHGFAAPPPDIAGNVAGLIRFDELLGVSLFQDFYSKTEIVFGAIPSLHCAYSAIMLYYAFRFGVFRFSSTAYFLIMGFSAVYLNHHYLIDVLLGYFYGILGSFLVDKITESRIVRQTPNPS